MAPDVGELIGALPAEVQAEDTQSRQLSDLLARISERRMPTGAVSRLWSLGGLNARIALAYLAYWVRSCYASEEERVWQRNEAHLTAAIKLLWGMSYMRGLVMKVGQAVSNFPTLVPEEFAETLSRLHFDAPPMHYALLREHVRNELGAEPESLFASFDKEAFAAASLGQVHRARLKNGERVAVKIQYPGIGRTIRDDFRNLSALLLPMRLSGDWDNIKEQVENLRAVLEREIDYEREAEFLETARSCFDEGDGIVVPRVHRELSSSRVLTMDFVEGVHLDEYLATQPTQEDRDHSAERMMFALFRMAGRAWLWYGDPHPGNFVFMKDGRLGLLDFGCCLQFSEEDAAYYSRMCQSHRDGGAALDAALVTAMGYASVDEVPAGSLELSRAWSHWMCDCVYHEGLFDYGREEFMREGMAIIHEVGRKRLFRSRPINNWLFRHILGARAIAYRLRARVDMKGINEAEGAGWYEEGSRDQGRGGGTEGGTKAGRHGGT